MSSAELPLITIPTRKAIIAEVRAVPEVIAVTGSREYHQFAPLIDPFTGAAPIYPFLLVAYISWEKSEVSAQAVAGYPLFKVTICGASLPQLDSALLPLHRALLGLASEVSGVTVEGYEIDRPVDDVTALPGGQLIGEVGGLYRFFCQMTAG